MSTQTGGGWDTAVETQDYIPSTSGGGAAPQGSKSIFIDQSESPVSIIGNSYLQNFLLGNKLEKGYGILTQKRFYYQGKSLTGWIFTTKEGVVSVDDIAFTEFTHTRRFGKIFLGVMFLLISLIGFTMPTAGGYISIPCWIAAAVLFIMFFVDWQTLFQVSFPGGGFTFDVRYYPIADMRDFQRQLHLLKDHIKEGRDA